MQPPMTLYEPIQVLKPITASLALVDGPIVRMGAMGASIPFPTRATVAKLSDGSLWVHSPTEPDNTLFEALDAWGPVRHLVSPNKIHYAWIGAWKARYPDAVAWASPGVRERAASQRIAVRFDADLEDGPPEAWAEDIDQLVFRGSRFMDEVVFLHRSSRTLILADLIENFEAEKVAPRWRWLIAVAGAMAPTGKAPADLRATFFGNKAVARACFERVRAWAPERVVLSHGAWIPEDGAARLEQAFAWLG